MPLPIVLKQVIIPEQNFRIKAMDNAKEIKLNNELAPEPLPIRFDATEQTWLKI